ncbi:MAG: hypothetical protein ACYCVH_15060 [Ignavibacteriaceae bacterium]
MHTQINIPAQSEISVLPQQGIARTFQENKPKILGHHSVKTTMIYTHVLNRGIGVRSPLD